MVSAKRPRGLLESGKGNLSRLERAQIRLIRRSFEPGVLNTTLRGLQRTIGAHWIAASIGNLRSVHGLDRVPEYGLDQSVIVVANHRSFFDLFAVASYLVKRGLRHRLLFPVRSKFFYDHPLGFAVNGAVSFFAMYPPVFRERERAALNLASLDETIRLVKQPGTFLGLHPEGKRNQTDDPYTLLPAQRGVGRIIHESGAPVIPVFVNGLTNDFVRLLRGNYDRTGERVILVFGEPVDFGDLMAQPPGPKVHRAVSEVALAAIARLGPEEREIRATS